MSPRKRLKADLCVLYTLRWEELGTLVQAASERRPRDPFVASEQHPSKDLCVFFACVCYPLKGQSKFLSVRGALLADSWWGVRRF